MNNGEIIVSVTTAVVSIVGTLFGVHFWRNRSNSNNNDTKVRIAEINSNGRDADKWQKRYEEVAGELHNVSSELRAFVTGLKVLFSAIMPQMSDRPDLVRSMSDFVQMVDKSDFSNKK